jgi:SSU ribosomal protein S2P
MLTNFPTIRKAIKKMSTIDKMGTDGTFANLSKRERLQITRQRAKLEKNLGSIADLVRMPSALFVVDVLKEQIAVREAKRLGIPVFGIVDTNSNPADIDFVIPANDDATKSIDIILKAMVAAVQEGLQELKVEKVEAESAEEPQTHEKRVRGAKKVRINKDDEVALNAKVAENLVKPTEE